MKIRDRIVELKRVKAADLMPHPKNWRKHPEKQQNAVRAVLAEIGYADALKVRPYQGGYQLLDGHLRAEVTPDTEVPVLVLDLDDTEAATFLSTFDPLAELAEMDNAIFADLLRDVQTGSEELQAMLSEMSEKAGIIPKDEVTQDEVPEPPKDPITKPGDVWILGDHRLLCGDSTKREDVERVMAGAKGSLIATDPPYGVDFSGAKYCPTAKEWKGIANDKKQGSDLREWLAGMWSIWLGHVHSDASFYSWAAAMEEGAAAAAMRDAGIHVQSQIVWVKNALVLGQADYQWKHENCWYGFLKGKKHRWIGGRSQTTVWEVKKVSNSDYVHPMQKPVELYAIPIRNHTGEGAIVAEPFSGSGTQIIAAEQLNRRCFAIEIDPAYCDVAVERWEKLTGGKAQKEKGP